MDHLPGLCDHALLPNADLLHILLLRVCPNLGSDFLTEWNPSADLPSYDNLQPPWLHLDLPSLQSVLSQVRIDTRWAKQLQVASYEPIKATQLRATNAI